jgi:[lysine-biosynthesis-protein LysW]--L-2-aminoadipate ligase
MRLAVYCSRLRIEEKLIFSELNARGVPYERIDDGSASFDLGAPVSPWQAVWNRSLAFGRALYTQKILEAQGALCLNSADVIETCGDKLKTSLALQQAGVANLRTHVAFTPEAALQVLEEIGYPAVLKPVVGSWGRLVAKLNDPDAARAVLEDRATLGSWQQQVFYIQEYVEKPGRDLRVFIMGEEPVAAIYRNSEHWITNTALGATVTNCPLTSELTELASGAARAVGRGLLAVDLVETPDGLAVLEVNHSAEFKNSIEPTGVNLPGLMVDYVVSQAAARAA